MWSKDILYKKTYLLLVSNYLEINCNNYGGSRKFDQTKAWTRICIGNKVRSSFNKMSCNLRLQKVQYETFPMQKKAGREREREIENIKWNFHKNKKNGNTRVA